MNEIKQQWIIKRKLIFGSTTYHQLVLVEGDRYFISSGEIGNYRELQKEVAKKYINTDLI